MKKPNPRITCPTCGMLVRSNLIERHTTACGKLPDNETMLKLYKEGQLTRTEMARMWGVDHNFVRRQYERRLGITFWKRKFVRQPSVPLAGAEFAPRYGIRVMGGCEDCPEIDECRRWIDLGLWPLCCRPMQHEVALAYRDGRIAFDGDMPEWLPELVRELTP